MHPKGTYYESGYSPYAFEPLKPDTDRVEYAEVLDEGYPAEDNPRLPERVLELDATARILEDEGHSSAQEASDLRPRQPDLSPVMSAILDSISRSAQATRPPRASSPRRAAPAQYYQPVDREKPSAPEQHLITKDELADVINLLEASAEGSLKLGMPSSSASLAIALRAERDGKNQMMVLEPLEQAVEVAKILDTVKGFLWEDSSLTTQQLLEKYRSAVNGQPDLKIWAEEESRYARLCDIVGARSLDGRPKVSGQPYYVDLQEFGLRLLEDQSPEQPAPGADHRA